MIFPHTEYPFCVFYLCVVLWKLLVSLCAELETMFTGEESFGRFLDLHQLHDQFSNLKQFEKVDYTKYVTEFDNFQNIPRDKKNLEYKKYALPPVFAAIVLLTLFFFFFLPRYARYLELLYTYLEGFIKRVKPLTDLARILADLEAKFEEDWMLKKVPGWIAQEENEGNPLYCVACESLFWFFPQALSFSQPLIR